MLRLRDLVSADLAAGDEGSCRLVVDGAEMAQLLDELIKQHGRDCCRGEGDWRPLCKDDRLGSLCVRAEQSPQDVSAVAEVGGVGGFCCEAEHLLHKSL